MKITNDDDMQPTENNNPSPSQNINPQPPPQQNVMLPQQSQLSNSNSYASLAAQSKGAIPKPASTKKPKATHDFWTDQIRQIVSNHNKGARILIVMRGPPGCGKTYLSKLLVENLVGPTFNNYKNHILSTDDYFMIRGQYRFDKYQLSYAHAWNHDRVRGAIYQGLSPIIVDNTNIEPWETHAYVSEGVRHGYIIEVIEPTTPWAKKANQLARKNTHGVPLVTIKRMLENYSEGITGESLIRFFGLSYAPSMTPPVMRLVPPVKTEEIKSTLEQTPRTIQLLPEVNQLPNQADQNITSQPANPSVTESIESASAYIDENILTQDLGACASKNQSEPERPATPANEEIDNGAQEEVKQKLVLEAQKRLEELEKFDAEWENGEKWEENVASSISTSQATALSNITTFTTSTVTSITDSATSSSNPITSLITNLESKPPRKDTNTVLEASSAGPDKLMKSVNDCQDWRDISLFMPPWDVPAEQPNIEPEIPVETTTSSTCVEIGDTSLSGKYKIITVVSRDINEFYIAPVREKIPQKRMFDKSTMTSEGNMMTFNCPQKERHFIAFRNLFNHIGRESLRDIFDNCCGDANWAVESILGGGAKYELKKPEDQDGSDLEEESVLENPDLIQENTGISVPQPEKKKRDVVNSEENKQLKKQIEQNVVISDRHYSDHCLKIRKMRRGEHNLDETNITQPSTSTLPDTASISDKNNTIVPKAKTEPNNDSSDDEDCSGSNMSECDRIVNIDVGRSFIKDLDEMFGRKDMEYPENIRFNISIPTSLLNEINALWMESMMFQLDELAKQSAAMVKRDEDFARQIALKEAELMSAGKEPDVPDFKEIMDLELAISLHMKDVSGWRNNIPNDLAAKMSQEKLYALFPEIDKDTLLEMLMAHDNNFKATVEILLISMGRNDILDKENGLNKFVMEKELERSQKILQEQRKELKECQWPSLSQGEKVEMSTVQSYRDEAEEHLKRRNINAQKAEDYVRRGMTQVASFCSDLVSYHKTRYDHANSMAVATLMQYHANNSPDNETVDLHFFRVKEAMEALDLFIDTHIQKLRDGNRRNTMLFFITGRGLHSNGRPRIKPACIKRLKERGLQYTECNPGLLRSRVSCDDKLTYQVT